jgi:hypothetical protein
MKTPISAVCLFLTCGLYAQTPTTIGPHRMGETFDQWLSINSLDLADICQKHHQDKKVDYKAVCKTLSGIRDTGAGVFTIVMGDISSQPFSWRFVDGKAAQVTARLDIAELAQQVQFLNSR